MTENQLSGKELYEQKKAEKARGSGAASTGGSGSRWWTWLVVALVLAGAVYGVYKLATSTPPGGAGPAGSLTEPLNAGDWLAGNPEAAIQLVEYSDLQCPACADYAPMLARLVEEHGEEIAVAYRHFPLRSIHQNAQAAAEVAEAAGVQGKFWEAVEILFQNQSAWASQIAPQETFYRLLAPLGLNLVKLKQDAESSAAKNKVDQHYQSGLRSGVDATPSFFLNGERIRLPNTYEDFRDLVLGVVAPAPITNVQ